MVRIVQDVEPEEEEFADDAEVRRLMKTGTDTVRRLRRARFFRPRFLLRCSTSDAFLRGYYSCVPRPHLSLPGITYEIDPDFLEHVRREDLDQPEPPWKS